MWFLVGIVVTMAVLWVVRVVRRQARVVDQVSQAWLAEHRQERDKQP
jgi:hypothetical protein